MLDALLQLSTDLKRRENLVLIKRAICAQLNMKWDDVRAYRPGAWTDDATLAKKFEGNHPSIRIYSSFVNIVLDIF